MGQFCANSRKVQTGVRLAICDSQSLATVVSLNDLGASFLESQNRKPDPGLVFSDPIIVYTCQRVSESAVLDTVVSPLSSFRDLQIFPSGN